MDVGTDEESGAESSHEADNDDYDDLEFMHKGDLATVRD
jgi:hypothetical protein